MPTHFQAASGPGLLVHTCHLHRTRTLGSRRKLVRMPNNNPHIHQARDSRRLEGAIETKRLTLCADFAIPLNYKRVKDHTCLSTLAAGMVNRAQAVATWGHLSWHSRTLSMCLSTRETVHTLNSPAALSRLSSSRRGQDVGWGLTQDRHWQGSPWVLESLHHGHGPARLPCASALSCPLTPHPSGSCS